MSDSNAPEARPYHHGDLRRALVDAARRLLETEGQAAMSLRAVAREAGVSPAAPYHHFKDKAELMDAIAAEGWELLAQDMYEAGSAAPKDQLAIVTTYVTFARSRPALYRVMFDAARDKETLPFDNAAAEGAFYTWYRQSIHSALDRPLEPEAELEILAAWASAHGLAEMAGFQPFERLKEQLGGETPFIKAVLEQMGRHRTLG